MTKRSFRIDDPLWDDARRVASERNLTMEQIITAILNDYAERARLPVPPHEPDHTPRRSVKVPPAAWEAASELATEAGESVSEVIRRGLERLTA